MKRKKEETIRLIRFMSKEEFDKYKAGEILTNYTDHKRDLGARTGSKGFCFFLIGDDLTEADRMLRYLHGIATLDKVLVAETARKNVRESLGEYLDTEKTLDDVFNSDKPKVPMIERTEYCTTWYSNRNFVQVAAGDVAYEGLWPERVAWSLTEDKDDDES